ncbi:MafI family immunity protein [Brevibacillus antibioticus]|uniref:MafI family immunity protein n=1 Tax=Brevibacillus antibioticus TaxID=2570228 RepID=A0A4U2Y2A3_9BACL|nr:MafI family immunity protein [Brevibacillus antibioticus]TKI54550.1 MafI family immunity protein [Brevibacillus antibioticus]
MMYPNQSQNIIRIVKETSGMPKKDMDIIFELLDHNEWGVALEHLCSTIIEERIIIQNDVFEAIKKIGELMEMDPNNWSQLIHLIQ